MPKQGQSMDMNEEFIKDVRLIVELEDQNTRVLDSQQGMPWVTEIRDQLKMSYRYLLDLWPIVPGHGTSTEGLTNPSDEEEQ
jgi:hypothetical protein